MGWGDEMMASGEVDAVYNGDPVAILNSAKGSPRWHVAWENNKQISPPGQSYKASVVNGPGARPYAASVTDRRWYWKQYNPKPGRIVFSAAEQEFSNRFEGGFIAIEPNCKTRAEAENRYWQWEKWQQLADMLKEYRVVQIAPHGAKILRGVEHIVTDTPRLMAAVLQKARAFVSTEGGFHHTAAAVRVPGVVIFGHFIGPMVTGYAMHRNLSAGGLGCGSRVKCSECRAWLDALKAEDVYNELRQILQ